MFSPIAAVLVLFRSLPSWQPAAVRAPLRHGGRSQCMGGCHTTLQVSHVTQTRFSQILLPYTRQLIGEGLQSQIKHFEKLRLRCQIGWECRMYQAQMGMGFSRNPPSEKYANLSVSDAFNWQYDLLCIHCATCEVILTCTLHADSGLRAKPRPLRTCSRFHIVQTSFRRRTKGAICSKNMLWPCSSWNCSSGNTTL